jgi:hypothetical protein
LRSAPERALDTEMTKIQKSGATPSQTPPAEYFTGKVRFDAPFQGSGRQGSAEAISAVSG